MSADGADRTEGTHGSVQQVRTFTDLKPMVDNPRFARQREHHLTQLDLTSIDGPIVELVRGFSRLPYCFTLQSCYGHFIHSRQQQRHNVDPLPSSGAITTVEYRIAYVALCIDNSVQGRELLDDLERIAAFAPRYIQLGCAEWFWSRQVNSYALQVEPRRHMTEDSICIGYQEALRVEAVRNWFFAQLSTLIAQWLDRTPAPGIGT
jgi:hypothetical protein